MKECYQCGKEVQWLAPDSRCSDCTRLTPEQITGEEPMPGDLEEVLEAFLKKYGLVEEDLEEDMSIFIGQYKGNHLQLNIFLNTDTGHAAYHLFLAGGTVSYQVAETDQQAVSFFYKAEKALDSLR